MKKVLVLISISACMLGCAKSDDKKHSNQQNDKSQVEQKIETVDLTNKSTAEILDLKYNTAQLKCSLWSQNSKQINLKLPANYTTTMNLRSPLSLPKELILKASINNHQIQVNVKVTKVSHHDSIRYVDSSKNIVNASFSPYVEIESGYVSQTKISKVSSSTGSGSNFKTVREQDHVMILQNHSAQLTEQQPKNKKGPLVSDSFANYVSCALNTDIKQVYQNQLSVEKSN